MNMIMVPLLAIGLVWAVRPQSVIPVILRILGRVSALPFDGGPQREGLTRAVRVVGIVMSVIGLVLVQLAVHAAMTHRPH